MKTLLITGGSSGIGAAVSLQAAREGWSVFIGYKTGRERAQTLADKIRASGGQARPISLSLEDLSSINACLDSIASASTSLEALALAASPNPVLASFLKTSEQQFFDQLNANLIGNHYLISETWKRFFRPSKGGHIIALLSEAMWTPPWPHMSSYVMGKRALQCLLECAMAEFGPGGLRASAVSPDYTATPMLLTLEEHILEAARHKRGGKFLDAAEIAGHVMDCLNHPPAEPILSIRHVALSPVNS